MLHTETQSHFQRWRPAWSRLRCGLWLWLLVGVGGLATAQSNLPVVESTNEIREATSQLGKWIWDTNTFDKQTCRFWRTFEIPSGTTVSRATLLITVDNGYRLFLDGREIGRGSDWKTLTQYDVRWLLNPGQHVIAVEGFNDRLAGGLIFSLQVELVNQQVLHIVSDDHWRVVPLTEKNWVEVLQPQPGWIHAKIEGGLGTPPWNNWPYAVVTEAALRPLHKPFWEKLWFQVTVLGTLGGLLVLCLWLVTQLALQSKSQRLLQLQRARIARDIHDDLGAQLTQLVLLGEIARSELPAQSGVRAQVDRICDQARDVARTMDEIVWAVSSRRDTLPDFAAYVCKYAQTFLKDTAIRCWLDVEAELPPAPFDLAIRRNLLLAVKEALNNAAKHSGASELHLRIHTQGDWVRVVVQDNGRGFDPAAADATRNGISNMAQRMAEVGGRFKIQGGPGLGCWIEFDLPLTHSHRRPRWLGRLLGDDAIISELENPHVANGGENGQA